MKKITSLLLVLVLLLSCTSLFSACDSNNNNSGTNTDNCQHSYDFITTEATCSEGGNATFKCSLCGDTISEYEDAYGHLPSNDGYCVDCGINTVQYISNRSIPLRQRVS